VTDRLILQKSLLRLVAKLPVVQVQNRFMSCTDRDFALALMGLQDEDAEHLLALVSPSKANRVREEVRLQEARHVEGEHVVVALKSIILSLESNRTVAGRRSYLRPRRPRSDQ
jgi:hypothetical protein